MKRISLWMMLAGTIFSCKDTWVHPWPDIAVAPEEPKPQIVHPPIDFPVSETKEPYFELHDAGFEAYLIMLSIDSDNQINGKVSREDVTQLKELTRTSPVYPLHPIVITQKKEFLERKYGKIPEIESFEDIKHLENINLLEIYGGKNIDLTHNKNLEKINWRASRFDVLDLRGLENLKEAYLGMSPMPSGYGSPGKVLLHLNSSLQDFKYWGLTPSIDFSGAKNLKVLHFSEAGHYADTVLDLSANVHLEEVSLHTGSGHKVKVLISPESKAKMDLNPAKWWKSDNLEWVVKK
ncbi:MAG: hypothetical protein KF870_07600 [Leadbetterella sp.]|nr:hypothetical protein [Leadbetterella sp.]